MSIPIDDPNYINRKVCRSLFWICMGLLLIFSVCAFYAPLSPYWQSCAGLAMVCSAALAVGSALEWHNGPTSAAKKPGTK